MTPDERERMHILCERIATELDREKFKKFVHELNVLFDSKERRLELKKSPRPNAQPR